MADEVVLVGCCIFGALCALPVFWMIYDADGGDKWVFIILGILLYGALLYCLLSVDVLSMSKSELVNSVIFALNLFGITSVSYLLCIHIRG